MNAAHRPPRGPELGVRAVEGALGPVAEEWQKSSKSAPTLFRGVVMRIVSAGILLFRSRNSVPEVFLVHPGGPYWARKDIGSWSVPKGLVEPDEDELVCARREFKEETGCDIICGENTRDLGVFHISVLKTLRVWAVEGDFDPGSLMSNSFELEWPPKSGHMRTFPEIDRGAWFAQTEAKRRIAKGQRPIIARLYALL
jgi:predicted NUDIX family NTP pyrophosphohydrolase